MGLDSNTLHLHIRSFLGQWIARRALGNSETAMIDTYTALFFLALFVMGGGGFYLAFRLFWKAGFHFIPQQMKQIYHTTRQKLHESRWG